MKFTIRPGSVTAPQGFFAGAVHCNIKKLETGKGSKRGPKPDLGVIVSAVPAAVAGMFTTNQVCAAPVRVTIPRASRSAARAVVVNSGNANACTGAVGIRDAEEMAKLTALALNAWQSAPGTATGARARRQIRPADVMVASTGRIGVPLPMAKVRAGIRRAVVALGSRPEDAGLVAHAIMTSDTQRKEVAVEFPLGGRAVRIGGICKGAGMIQPGMSATGRRPAATPLHATMLAFLTTDVAIESVLLKLALREAVATSFNRITVDGDMSTNDCVLLLANGVAGNRMIRAAGEEFAAAATADGAPRWRALLQASYRDFMHFLEALRFVTRELAWQIVRDGEGVSRFVTVRVRGARSPAEAELAARSVANSSLVKTSWCGGDPNWGRILDALGYSAARVEEQKIDLAYRSAGSPRRIYALKRGKPARTPFSVLCAAVAAREFELEIDLNLGGGEAVIYAADLTEAYVDFNKGDVTNPAALGG